MINTWNHLQQTGLGKVEMNEIFEHADILSLHLPLTEESTYLVEQKYINRFKKPIYLINFRGKCVHKNCEEVH